MIRSSQDTIAVLDIGSSKTCCTIARSGSGDDFEILGIGHQATSGLSKGKILNLDKLRASVGTAIHMAEKKSRETIQSVVLSMSSPDLVSDHREVEISLPALEVRDKDLRRLHYLAQQALITEFPDRIPLHVIPLSYKVDASHDIVDPTGMFGHTLSGKLHIITTSKSNLNHLVSCISRCHLDVSMVVAAPYASAHSALTEEDKQLGTTLIDMGADTTSFILFEHGTPLFVGCIPVGGQHITSDIARGLGISLSNAERLKNLYGYALAIGEDENQYIRVPSASGNVDGESIEISRRDLVQIIQARLEECFELVMIHLKRHGYWERVGQSIVLTGGASQMLGLPSLATHILKKRVRVACPHGLKGVQSSYLTPTFAASFGLLSFTQDYLSRAQPENEEKEKLLSLESVRRLGTWLRENF